MIGVTVKLWADPETDGAKACCSPEAVLGARAARPLARHPSPHPRPRGGVPPPRRRRLPLRLRGRAHAQPLHPLQRRGADRGDGRPRRAARRLPPRHRPLRAHRRRRRRAAARRGGRRRPRTRATCWRPCPPSLLGRLRFPLTELTKPEVREIAARHGLAVARSPRARTSASSPARASGASCAATAACASARAPSSTAPVGRSAATRGHHNFTVGQRRGIGVSAPEPLYVLATDADGEHGHRRHPGGARDAQGPPPRRGAAPRRRQRRRGQAPLPLPPLPAAIARRRAGPPSTPWSSSCPRPSPAPPRADGGAARRRGDRRPRHDRRRRPEAATESTPIGPRLAGSPRR